jgi:thioredoxin-like negative regulator of GroEL
MPMQERAHEPALQRRPRLLFFYSPSSGRCRRTEAFIAQVLQHRRNHETFELIRVSVDRRPDLARRFAVDEVPTILIVEDRRVKRRIVQPRGCRELEEKLHPWLR